MFDFLKTNARWLGAGALLAFSSAYGQTFFISLFAGHIQRDFGLSHGEWGQIYMFGTLASAVVMVWAGTLTDAFRARILGPVVLGLLAVACVSMALNPWVWGLPFVIFLLRFSGQGMLSHISVVSMSRWFVATRGRALAVATLGFSVAESLLPMAFVAMLGFIYWKNAWLLAAAMALVAIPLLRWLLAQERTPQSIANSDVTTGMNNQHWTRTGAITHPLFWFMMPALLGPSAFNTTFFFFQVHFADIKGVEHLHMVAMFPVYTVAGISAVVLSGILLDRLGTARLLPFYQLPMVVAFCVFAYAQGLGGILLGFVFLAMTAGANSTLPNAFWAEFYGTKNLGAIKAAAAAIMVLGSAIGPWAVGYFLDAGVTLETQFIWVAGFFIFATCMMWFGIWRYKSLLSPPLA